MRSSWLVLTAVVSLSAGAAFAAFAAGPSPAPGRATTAKTTLWAKVTSGGSLDGNSGATAASRSSAGDYRVTFERNIKRCALTATMNAPTGSSFEMIGGIEAVAISDKVVRVVTYNENSGPVSNNFHLVVNCKPTVTPTSPSGSGEAGSGDEGDVTTKAVAWARVGSDGSLSASSLVTSASRTSAGDYRVTFDEAIDDCALTATMMAPTGSSFEMIGGIEAVAISSKVVRVVTYNENSGPVSNNFHLVATC